jgi:hypothetical protein
MDEDDDGSALARKGEGGAEDVAPGRNSEIPLPLETLDMDLPRTLI